MRLTQSLCALYLTAVGACADAAATTAVHVQVSGSHGEPLAGARLRLDGRAVAVSDASGQAWLELDSRGVGRVELSIECPDGYHDPPVRMLRLRHEATRRLSMACEPSEHHALLVVRAMGAEGLPVRVNGEHVGTVGEHGTLHADLIRAAGSELRICVDTRDRPQLRPQDPVLQVRLDRDEIILVDQRFERQRPRRGRRKRRAERPPRTLPRRLRAL